MLVRLLPVGINGLDGNMQMYLPDASRVNCGLGMLGCCSLEGLTLTGLLSFFPIC